MKSEELQELTRSDPLSLEEEFEMQKSWRNDEDKLTFLVLNRETFDTSKHELEALVGDTNLFLSENDDGEKVAEAEIMIASFADRGKGFGPEAMLQMFRYAIEHLKIDKFEAKIGFANQKSIKMFQKFGFEELSRSEVFEEVTLAKKVDENFKNYLRKNLDFREEPYFWIKFMYFYLISCLNKGRLES